MQWNLSNFLRDKCGNLIRCVVIQFSFLTQFGQEKVEICFHAIRFCHCIQLSQVSKEKHFRSQGTITVIYWQEMQLRQGSQNCQKRTDLFRSPEKYLIQNCRTSIELNATHNYCQENFIAGLSSKNLTWVISYDSYWMTQ